MHIFSNFLFKKLSLVKTFEGQLFEKVERIRIIIGLIFSRLFLKIMYSKGTSIIKLHISEEFFSSDLFVVSKVANKMLTFLLQLIKHQ